MKESKLKFKRYKINFKNKFYYVFIPFDYEDIWIVDWADWWYGGAWIEASIYSMKIVIACFCILAFNPFAICYFPVRKNKRPNTFSYCEHCEYDFVFKSTKIQLNDKDLRKIIKENTKYTKWTTYKFKFNLKRMEKYFNKTIRKLKDLPDQVTLKRADNHLNNHIVYYTFPQCYYQREAIKTYKWYLDLIIDDNWNSYYYKEHDQFYCPHYSFVYDGKKMYSTTYKRPSLTLYLELYDLNVINRYKKEKVYLVDKNKLD